MSASAIVAAIDAAMLTMAENGMAQTLEINGRKVIYHDLGELTKARETFSEIADNTSNKLPFGVYNTKPKGIN